MFFTVRCNNSPYGLDFLCCCGDIMCLCPWMEFYWTGFADDARGVVGDLFPVSSDWFIGQNMLTPMALLSGLANPALITVLAVLVMGEGIAKTGLLDRLAMLSGSLPVNTFWFSCPYYWWLFLRRCFFKQRACGGACHSYYPRNTKEAWRKPIKIHDVGQLSAILGGMTTLFQYEPTGFRG